jgi:addiction module HigA family antidote
MRHHPGLILMCQEVVDWRNSKEIEPGRYPFISMISGGSASTSKTVKPQKYLSPITTNLGGDIMNTLHEPTPGEILKSEFLDAYGITQYRLAVDAKMPPTRVSEIIRGKRSISLDTARRLSRYFGTTVSFWINLQVQYDLLTTDPKVKREIARISPVTSVARTKKDRSAGCTGFPILGLP